MNLKMIDFAPKITKYIFDHVYIISLEKNNLKKKRCIQQLLKHNIQHYEFFDAIDTISTNHYNGLYEEVVKDYDEEFIKHNYKKGALGCLLSHLKIVIDAKKKHYNSILILEEDFLIKNNFNEAYANVVGKIPNNWDFIYFGKKQGTSTVKLVNDMVYVPNDKTWATHAICIKHTIFDALIDTYTTLKLPVDLLLITLYDKYHFYTLYEDLFVTSFDSDIREYSIDEKKWNWKMNNYFNIDHFNIQKIIIWGFDNIAHTHHYIHNMYFTFFKEYFNNVEVLWFPDKPSIQFENALFFVSPAHGHFAHLPISDTSLYIFHLDQFSDNLGLSIEKFVNIPTFKNIIDSNRGILLLAREKITKLNYFDVDYQTNSICLPWFSNKKYHDIMNVKRNTSYYYKRNKEKECMCYFGSVWHLNIDMVNSLIDHCIDKNKKLLISGRFNSKVEKTHPLLIKEQFYDAKKNLMPSNEDTVDRLNTIYGVRQLFPIQGEEHFDNYISNRLIECICDGYIGISNNSIVTKLFKHVYCNKDISKLIDYVEALLKEEDKYCQVLNHQIDEILNYYYGYTLIKKMVGFLESTLLKQNTFYTLHHTNQYKLFFSNKCVFDDYRVIDSIHEINLVNNEQHNYVIREHEYDVFMLDKIISCMNYKIVIEDDYFYKSQLIQLCNKNNKKYILKKPLQIFCLLSSQRTGSTLVVDYIQKTSTKVLALSEIFVEYETSYDVTNKNGILYESKIKPLTNVHDHIQQFINIAEKNNYECLFFKYTIDFTTEYDSNFLAILEEIKQYNILYLERNNMDIFISKKLAEKNSYSNEVYQKNIDIDDFDTYSDFLNRKKLFSTEYLPLFKNIKKIHYRFIKEKNHKHNIACINKYLNRFYSTKMEYLVYEPYYEQYDIFNKKQHKFNRIDPVYR